ncbi:hypothetical protein [Actinoplanes sp. DH11]|uniref:hypothetical protein n=1 Tax=Actinoplanes sp. DH11 TaxID=2857011 RepID=UPI001E3E6752|nr:hypothetical protein [Actinoplanes sp. DH11]
MLALLISAAAGFFSWQTYRLATASAVANTAAPGVPAPYAVSSSAASVDRQPEPEEYPAVYAKEPLRVQVGCSAVLFLDLDEPRVDVTEPVADLRYDSRCGAAAPRLRVGPGADGGSRLGSADTDAAGCFRAIRTSPLGPGADMEVKKGAALCVRTSEAPAVLALVEIIDVGGTGTAGLRATAWRVPD